jgi:hypothetical protein
MGIVAKVAVAKVSIIMSSENRENLGRFATPPIHRLCSEVGVSRICLISPKRLYTGLYLCTAHAGSAGTSI